MIKNQIPNSKKPKFDLEERTFNFAFRIIKLIKSLSKDRINFELGKQIVRSGTSVGANYREANEAASRKDFLHKIKICKKEAKETKYWLRLIAASNVQLASSIKVLENECEELIKIFAQIVINTTRN